MGHVEEGDAVADFERGGEGVVADDVASEAGGAAEAVSVEEFAGVARAEDFGAVGHFEDVGHVAGGGDIEDGEVQRVLRQVEDGAGEDAGVEGDGFAGLEVNVELMFFAEVLDDADEAVDIVAGAGDVVAAAEVDPFQAGEKLGEFLLEGGDGVLKRVAVLFAEGVEVEAVEAVEISGGRCV